MRFAKQYVRSECRGVETGGKTKLNGLLGEPGRLRADEWQGGEIGVTRLIILL